MLYSLFKGASQKGAAIGISTSKLALLSYPQLIELTSTAAVLASSVEDLGSADAVAERTTVCQTVAPNWPTAWCVVLRPSLPPSLCLNCV